MTYEERYNPNLPWGYWLHADGGHHPLLIDGDGRRWSSVREAFWVGRLGMRVRDDRAMAEQLERMTAVLAAMSRRVIGVTEDVHDLFKGDAEYKRFYDLWLMREGLVASDQADNSHFSDGGRHVSSEGIAVLVMLASTRDPAVRFIPAGRAAMDTITPPETAEAERAAWLDRVEEFAKRLPFRFVRKDLSGKPTVALIGDGLGENVPIRRTIWMQTFADTDGRDLFHVWLASRLDRWEAWGETAMSEGAPILTQHLFALYVADPTLGERATVRPVTGFL